jgi:hypothetical protein
MRKATTLLGVVGLMSVALATTARAQDATPDETLSATPAAHRRIELGVAFLPMTLGRLAAVYGGMPTTLDTVFAPGVGVTASVRVFQGLSLGIAPQAIFNLQPKDPPSGAGITFTEIDAMARVAYTFRLVDTISVYAEVLPGYSILKPSDGDTAKGFVIGGGVGGIMDLGDRFFVNFGGGYQQGFQSRTETHVNNMTKEEVSVTTDVKTSFVRVSLGAGWRF